MVDPVSSEQRVKCKRCKWTVIPNSDFARKRYISRTCIGITAMQRVKCDACGTVKSRPGGSLV